MTASTTLGRPRRGRQRAAVVVLTLLLAAGLAAASSPPAYAAPSISVSRTTDLDPDGSQVTVRGSGFDTSKGIYVAFCVTPPRGAVPSPCGGGIDMDGSSGGSVWISDDPPPYGEGLAQPFGSGGSFEVAIRVTAAIGDIDCRTTSCAVVTRADHTRNSDRSQDVIVPVTFATPAPPPAPAPPSGGGGSDSGSSDGSAGGTQDGDGASQTSEGSPSTSDEDAATDTTDTTDEQAAASEDVEVTEEVEIAEPRDPVGPLVAPDISTGPTPLDLEALREADAPDDDAPEATVAPDASDDGTEVLAAVTTSPGLSPLWPTLGALLLAAAGLVWWRRRVGTS
jgi:hypothetical protein